MTDARVSLWGRDIGAVSWADDRSIAVFQFEPDFVDSNVELSPVEMPLSPDPYEFPGLAKEAFKGLPGLLADSLPDKFGNALINRWLVTQGRKAESFNPVERLCYIGTRGMGALEFHPTILSPSRKSRKLDISTLVSLANEALSQREQLSGVLSGDDDHEMLEDILRVGTSAGGARAKAILAWNEETGEFRSGQIDAGEGFGYWLMKFDGISDNRDKELADPQGFGLIEYGYYLMAVAAGIEMSECRLHNEGGRSHFMTRRFDRTANGGKLHMQSLAALRHFDFNAAGAYSYEQAVETIRLLGLSSEAVEQQFRRAVFNVIARNQDDHVKNISFLMTRDGKWRLSPAFDVSYSYNPDGSWTHQHQMSLNNKRDQFTYEDLIKFGAYCDLKEKVARGIIQEVHASTMQWPLFADRAGVPEYETNQILKVMRTDITAAR